MSDVIIEELSADMTGFFTCHYNHTTNLTLENSDSLYIFANGNLNKIISLIIIIIVFLDPETLLVPYEGSSEFIFIAVFQSQPATIPCKPTNSRTLVTLWKVHTVSGEPQEIKPDSNLGITYDPKHGFHFEYPRWDAETSVLECKAKIDDLEATTQVSIHWSSKYKKLLF